MRGTVWYDSSSSMMKHLGIILTLFGALVGCGENRHVVRGESGANTALAQQENERAYELIQKGKYEEAQAALGRAIAADVMFGPARNNLGIVYYRQGKLYEAAHEFQYAIKLMPHHPDPRNNLGLVFEKAGDVVEARLSDAVEAYEQARRIEPDNPEYIGNLARSKIKRGDRDEETKKLLEELVFKDSRESWRDWAKMKLLWMRGRESDPSGAATRPAER